MRVLFHLFQPNLNYTGTPNQTIAQAIGFAEKQRSLCNKNLAYRSNKILKQIIFIDLLATIVLTQSNCEY